MDDPVVNKNDTRQADLEIPSQTADAKKNLDEKLLANTGASAESVDAQAIRIMLDETKKSIDAKTRQLENQLAQAIERMKKSTAMTAQTSADSVSTLASQYDNIIAGIQQDIIELKGRMSKMSQDNDRMREMLLANDEKLEDIQLQMTQYSVSTADANLELDKPVLMILFGSGLLTLVLIILVIIFKLRTRASQRALSDDFDFDDSVADDVLLSNADGSIDLETPTDVEDEDQSKGGRSETVNANALDAPSSNPSEVQAALDGAAEVAIFNRDDEFYARAESTKDKLAKETPDVKVTVTHLEEADKLAAAINACDILVNATSVGMKPQDGISLVDKALLRKDLVVADTVYNPEKTQLILDAEEAGCAKAIGGKGMLLYQGAVNYGLFTGLEMPVEEYQAWQAEQAK